MEVRVDQDERRRAENYQYDLGILEVLITNQGMIFFSLFINKLVVSGLARGAAFGRSMFETQGSILYGRNPIRMIA